MKEIFSDNDLSYREFYGMFLIVNNFIISCDATRHNVKSNHIHNQSLNHHKVFYRILKITNIQSLVGLIAQVLFALGHPDQFMERHIRHEKSSTSTIWVFFVISF